MATNFNFTGNPEIIFGTGKHAQLPFLAKKYGKNVLVITGQQSFLKSKYWPVLVEGFEDNNISWNVETIAGEPSPEIVDGIVQRQINNKNDAVIAIGGGSVMDGGKAIAAMLPLAESVKHYLEGVGDKKHPGSTLPFIAVPTTSGTGSEATKNAVISRVGEDGFKKSLRHDNFMPDIALVDPALTIDCPPGVTAASGMDAFTQLLESYVSNNASIFTDSLALPALEKLTGALPIVTLDEPGSIEARSNMSYGALISGITLTNAGLGVIHGFASAIGGYFDIPHGIVCGTLMGSVNRINLELLLEVPDGKWAIHKYARVGKLFTTLQDKSDEFYCNLLIDKIEEWINKLNIPKFGNFGISSCHFEKIIEKTGLKNNPVKLKKEHLIRILEERT